MPQPPFFSPPRGRAREREQSMASDRTYRGSAWLDSQRRPPSPPPRGRVQQQQPPGGRRRQPNRRALEEEEEEEEEYERNRQRRRVFSDPHHGHINHHHSHCNCLRHIHLHPQPPPASIIIPRLPGDTHNTRHSHHNHSHNNYTCILCHPDPHNLLQHPIPEYTTTLSTTIFSSPTFLHIYISPGPLYGLVQTPTTTTTASTSSPTTTQFNHPDLTRPHIILHPGRSYPLLIARIAHVIKSVNPPTYSLHLDTLLPPITWDGWGVKLFLPRGGPRIYKDLWETTGEMWHHVEVRVVPPRWLVNAGVWFEEREEVVAALEAERWDEECEMWGRFEGVGEGGEGERRRLEGEEEERRREEEEEERRRRERERERRRERESWLLEDGDL